VIVGLICNDVALLILVIITLVAVLALIDALVTRFELDLMKLVVATSVVTGLILVVAKIEVGFWDDVVSELTEFRNVATDVAPVAVEVNAADDVVSTAFDWTPEVIFERMVDAAAEDVWSPVV